LLDLLGCALLPAENRPASNAARTVGPLLGSGCVFFFRRREKTSIDDRKDIFRSRQALGFIAQKIHGVATHDDDNGQS